MDSASYHVREAMLAWICYVFVRVCVLIASSAVLSVHRREVGGFYVILFPFYGASGCLTVLEQGSVGWMGCRDGPVWLGDVGEKKEG
jgi:hypothetical protein